MKVAIGEYSFIKDTSFYELEDLNKEQTGYALHWNKTLVLADLPDNTQSTRAEVNISHDVLCNEKMYEALKSMSSLMAFGAQGHFFRSDLVFLQ